MYIFYNLFLKYFLLMNLIFISLISLFFYDLLIIWFFMEISNLLFISMLLISSNNKKMIFFYFIIQIISSFFMIFPIIINNFMIINNYTLMILNISLLIKLSIPPFHFWFPMLSLYLSWDLLFIIMTLQKITPFYLFSLIKMNHLFMYIITILSSIIPPIMSMNITNMKMIMSYSSINQSSWMIILIYIKNIIWMKYFLYYTIITLSFFLIIVIIKLYKNSQYLNNMFIKTNILFMFIIFNISGLPPFSLFYMKWYSIFLFLKLNNLNLMLMIMMFSSLYMMFIYLNLTLMSLYLYKLENKMIKFNMMNYLSSYINLIFLSLFISLILIII